MKLDLTSVVVARCVLAAGFVLAFLLGFDRRTDGACSILVMLMLGAAVLLPWCGWATVAHRFRELLSPAGLPLSSRVCLWGLYVWVLLTGISVEWSSHPMFTAESFYRELLTYAGILVLCFRLLPSVVHREFVGIYGLRLANALSVLACVMAGVILVFVTCGDTARRLLSVDAKLVLVSATDSVAAPWRLLFPCQTHNKTAFWCMFMVYALIAAVLCVPSTVRARYSRALWGCGIACAVVALCSTLTRGVLVSLSAGVVLLFAGLLCARVASVRRVWAVAVAAIVLLFSAWAGSPKAWREYVSQPFRAHSWVANSSTTTGMRMVIWQYTLLAIAERPLLGHGGGWEGYRYVFEKKFPVAKAAFPASEFPPHHSHNVYLQVAFETGLVGLAAFVLFQLGRIGAVLCAAVRAVRGGDRGYLRLMMLVLAVELSFQIYCFSNYPMRRGMGLVMFLVWGCCFAASRVKQLGVRSEE